MAPLKLLSIILAASFVVGEIVRLELMPNLFIKPLDITVGIISVFGIIQLIIFKKVDLLYTDKIFRSVLLFFLIGFISLIFNSGNLSLEEFVSSFLYGVRFVSYAFLFMIIKNVKYSLINSTVYMFLTAGIVLLVFGFVQYLFYSDLRNLYYLGWDEHMYRLFATFLDPNFAGAFFVLFFTFVSGLFFYSLQNKKTFLKNFTIFIMCMALISIYLTFSRSALTMLFISSFVFLVLIKKLKLMFVLIAVSLVFFVISSKNFHIENVNPFRFASIEARLDSAKIAINIIRKNSILGVGFNSYRYAQIRYGFRDKENAIKSYADASSDNSFLFVLATTGVVGLLAYLYLLYSIIKSAYLKYKKLKTSTLSYFLSVVVIASFIGIIVDSLFINSLFYSFSMLWFWIILGLWSRDDISL